MENIDLRMKQNIPYFFSLPRKKMSIKQLERTQKAVIFKRETSTNKKNDAKVDSLKKNHHEITNF